MRLQSKNILSVSVCIPLKLHKLDNEFNSYKITFFALKSEISIKQETTDIHVFHKTLAGGFFGARAIFQADAFYPCPAQDMP